MEKDSLFSPFIMNWIEKFDSKGTDAALLAKIGSSLVTVLSPPLPTVRIAPNRSRKGAKEQVDESAAAAQDAFDPHSERVYTEKDLYLSREKSPFVSGNVKPAEFSNALLSKIVVPMMAMGGTYYFYGYYTGPNPNDVSSYRLYPRRCLKKIHKHLGNQYYSALEQHAPKYDATLHKGQVKIEKRFYPMIDIRAFTELYKSVHGTLKKGDGEDDDGEENDLAIPKPPLKERKAKKAAAQAAKKAAAKPPTDLSILTERAFEFCRGGEAGKIMVNEVPVNDRGEIEIPGDLCLYFQTQEASRLTMKPTMRKLIPTGPMTDKKLVGHELENGAMVRALGKKLRDPEFMEHDKLTFDECYLIELATYIIMNLHVVFQSAVALCCRKLSKELTEETTNEIMHMIGTEDGMKDGITKVFEDCLKIQWYSFELYMTLVRYRKAKPVPAIKATQPPLPSPADNGVTLK